MAKVVDPRIPRDPKVIIPGLKPPVRDFVPSDDGDPSEVDAFLKMIRDLRRQGPAAHADASTPANELSTVFAPSAFSPGPFPG
jgi:hypothetical protein